MEKVRIILIRDFRKKALWILGSVLFWVLMFSTSSYFIHNHPELKTSAKRVTEYSSYKSSEGGFAFNYPSTFALTPQNFPGGEIPYHVDLRDTAGSGYGYVQIWNLSLPLQEFLAKSKEASRLTYKYFNSRKVKVNGFTGYSWDYSFLGGNHTYYKGNEVFLEGKNQMYRISYFMPESQWNDTQKEIFTTMVRSFNKF